MENGADMTEQEFINKLKTAGLGKKSIIEIVEVSQKIMKDDHQVTYDELLHFAIEAHEKDKNKPEGFITVD